MINAVYITNNAFDAVLLQDGTYIEVDKEVFSDYISPTVIEWLSNWHGTESWEDINKNIEMAAEELGEILAYYQDDKLVISDQDQFNQRKDFFLS